VLRSPAGIQAPEIPDARIRVKRGASIAHEEGMSVFKTISLVSAGALLALVGSALAAII